MLNICATSSNKPPEMIFKQCIETRFHSEWKKIMLFVFIKGRQTSTSKYRPVSLLPIFGELLERLQFTEMFEFYY